VRTLLAIIACIELFLVAFLGWVAVVLVYLPTFWFDKKRILSGRTLRRTAQAAVRWTNLLGSPNRFSYRTSHSPNRPSRMAAPSAGQSTPSP